MFVDHLYTFTYMNINTHSHTHKHTKTTYIITKTRCENGKNTNTVNNTNSLPYTNKHLENAVNYVKYAFTMVYVHYS